MNKNRLEIFSDGMIAIIITIIVALIWLIPDTRIERLFEEERKKES